MIGKVIAVVAIVIAGVAAFLIVARPALDPDLVVGYWQRVDDGTGAPGPALIRIDRDGADYTLVGAVSPAGEYTGVDEEFTSTVETDKSGVSLKTTSGGAAGGAPSWIRVRIEPAGDGSTLTVSVIPWEDDNSGVPLSTWQFERVTGDADQLDEQIRQQMTAPAATEAPAPAP